MEVVSIVDLSDEEVELVCGFFKVRLHITVVFKFF